MKSKILFVLTNAALMAWLSFCPVAAQSNRLHYTHPATFFEEALPIGNGTLGAMIYGGVDEEKLSLNDITLWTGEPDMDVYAPEAYKNIEDIREGTEKPFKLGRLLDY